MKRLPILMVSGVGLLAAVAGRPRPARWPGSDRTAQTPSPAVPRAPGPRALAVTSASDRPRRPSGRGSQVGLQAWFTRQGKLFGTQRGVPATAGIGQAALDRC